MIVDPYFIELKNQAKSKVALDGSALIANWNGSRDIAMDKKTCKITKW